MATKAIITAEQLDKLVAFVREYNVKHDMGCAKGHAVYNGGFHTSVVQYALECGALETRKGKGGGLWPAGDMPAPKTDGTPSCTGRAFDLLLTISRDTSIPESYRQAARALFDERESLNAARRKD